VHRPRPLPRRGGRHRVLATVEGLRRYERRLTIEGHRFRVVAIRQGADQLVEVDGVPHRVSQDDAGLVRAPAPSVVVSVNVAPGTTGRPSARPSPCSRA
jgi:hypothetical protein